MGIIRIWGNWQKFSKHNFFKAIPHNLSADTASEVWQMLSQKAQIILMSYRAFWQRRDAKAAAAGAVLKPQGGIVRCCLNCPPSQLLPMGKMACTATLVREQYMPFLFIVLLRGNSVVFFRFALSRQTLPYISAQRQPPTAVVSRSMLCSVCTTSSKKTIKISIPRISRRSRPRNPPSSAIAAPAKISIPPHSTP